MTPHSLQLGLAHFGLTRLDLPEGYIETIDPLTFPEFKQLWDAAREVDRKEWGGVCDFAYRAYRHSCDDPLTSAHRTIKDVNGNPVCVFGVCSEDQDVMVEPWRFWLLGTETLNHNPVSLTKIAKKTVDYWSGNCITIEAHLLKSNTTHRRWLKMLGFKQIDRPHEHLDPMMLMRFEPPQENA